VQPSPSSQNPPEQLSLAHAQPKAAQFSWVVALQPSPEQRPALQFAQGAPTSIHRWLASHS
jgi:hypothetical protein